MSAHHGNTPAAWTGVIVALAGFLVGSIGLMNDPVKMPIFWVGIALLPIAFVVFFVMDKMGFGDNH